MNRQAFVDGYLMKQALSEQERGALAIIGIPALAGGVLGAGAGGVIGAGGSQIGLTPEEQKIRGRRALRSAAVGSIAGGVGGAALGAGMGVTALAGLALLSAVMNRGAS